MKSIWILDDEPGMRWVLEKALDKSGWPVRCFTDGHALVRAIEDLSSAEDSQAPAVLVSDVRMPGLDGFQVLSRVKASLPTLPVILMTAYTDLDTTVAAFSQGVFDYLAKPFDIQAALALIARAAGSTQGKPAETSLAPGLIRQIQSTPQPVGDTGLLLPSKSQAMQEVFRAIGRLARSSATVLITGESGTGKELVASALHQHSSQASGPFIAVNAAAIPRDLLEAELFGHERGAFTGAVQMRRGRFEEADGGTLFLDEIGDMPAELQTRLLRVLSESSFYRVGGSRPIKVKVRVVAATHQPLEDRVMQGRFRADLFHRLNVIRLRLPPLRQRPEDIELLAQQFLQQAAKQLQVPVRILSPQALQALQRFQYPGNIRQLENICQWLTVMSHEAWVRAEDLPPEVLNTGDPAARTAPTAANARVPGAIDAPSSSSAVPPGAGPAGTWQQALAVQAAASLSQHRPDVYESLRGEFDRVLLRQALLHAEGQRGRAAAMLGIGRNTLTRKAQALALDAAASGDGSTYPDAP
ncbi:nitrogen regulation protein NR(I) [Castellaniella sp.]|uniref:nitrogen regulation protein NR(I) n=1 Tax=Castellaniella sp. TaxID=1955812 RepID=UPI002AFDF635|nr:nitrogen regulation protein NR(I) [Castellaniella sp.]